MAAQFRSASDQLDSLQDGITQDLKTAVASVNSLTSQIADLNAKIANAQGSGHDPNTLLDQRDTAISDLSKIVQVSTVAASDGTVGVFLGGGQKLVLGADATRAHDRRRPVRREQGADRHQGRRDHARLPRRLHRRRIGRRPACGCRTTTSPTRAA